MVTNVRQYNGELLSDSKILCDSMDHVVQCSHINFLLEGLNVFSFFFKQVPWYSIVQFCTALYIDYNCSSRLYCFLYSRNREI